MTNDLMTNNFMTDFKIIWLIKWLAGCLTDSLALLIRIWLGKWPTKLHWITAKATVGIIYKWSVNWITAEKNQLNQKSKLTKRSMGDWQTDLMIDVSRYSWGNRRNINIEDILSMEELVGKIRLQYDIFSSNIFIWRNFLIKKIISAYYNQIF